MTGADHDGMGRGWQRGGHGARIGRNRVARALPFDTARTPSDRPRPTSAGTMVRVVAGREGRDTARVLIAGDRRHRA